MPQIRISLHKKISSGIEWCACCGESVPAEIEMLNIYAYTGDGDYSNYIITKEHLLNFLNSDQTEIGFHHRKENNSRRQINNGEK